MVTTLSHEHSMALPGHLASPSFLHLHHPLPSWMILLSVFSSPSKLFNNYKNSLSSLGLKDSLIFSTAKTFIPLAHFDFRSIQLAFIEHRLCVKHLAKAPERLGWRTHSPLSSRSLYYSRRDRAHAITHRRAYRAWRLRLGSWIRQIQV